jgi:hypothetical protein
MTTDKLKIAGGSQSLEQCLRSAQPHLILRLDPVGARQFKATPYIRHFELADEVIDEGYDPYHSPLGCPVYWRIINRGDQQVYSSTFLATRAQVIKAWGAQGLAYCDRTTGMAVARTETMCPPQINAPQMDD